MAFDLKSAKEVKGNVTSGAKKGFDIKSAVEVKPNELDKPGMPIARRIMEKIGQNLTNPKTRPIGGLMTNSIGSIASSAAGIPEENFAATVLAIGGMMVGARIGKPNLGFGIGSAAGKLLTESAKKLRGTGNDINVADVILVGAGAAAGGKIIDSTLKAVGLSAKLIPEGTRAKFFDKALQAVEVGKKALSRNFERGVNTLIEKYPNTKVDMSGVLGRVKKMLGEFGEENLVPQLKTAVERSPNLAKAVENPSSATTLTLREAQDLKNAVTSTTNNIIKKAVKGKTTPNERVVFDILDEIDEKIVGAFPQMMGLKSAYKAGKRAFDMARTLVEPGVSVEKAIFSKPSGFFGVGGTPFMGSTQGKRAAKEIMSMTVAGEKMFKAAKLAHDINRAADTVGRISQIVVGGAIVSKLTGKDKQQAQVFVG